MIELALAIAASHPAFAGHFPSRPIVPGVVLLDTSLRALTTHIDIDQDALASTICKIVSAKFLSPVGPGEPLRLEVEMPCEVKCGAASSSTVQSSRYGLRIVAGEAANERLAVMATIVFESRIDPRLAPTLEASRALLSSDGAAST